MTDFKRNNIPAPDYDSDDINYISQKTEFSEDVYIYGKLYANLVGGIDYVSVKDFGVVGDGKTDDTLALQKALDEIKGKGKLNGKGTQLIKAGDVLQIHTPGGAGFGDYSERDQILLDKDLENEFL